MKVSGKSQALSSRRQCLAYFSLSRLRPRGMYLSLMLLLLLVFSPCSSILGLIMRVSDFFVEGSGGRLNFGLKETGTVQLFA